MDSEIEQVEYRRKEREEEELKPVQGIPHRDHHPHAALYLLLTVLNKLTAKTST